MSCNTKRLERSLVWLALFFFGLMPPALGFPLAPPAASAVPSPPGEGISGRLPVASLLMASATQPEAGQSSAFALSRSTSTSGGKADTVRSENPGKRPENVKKTETVRKESRDRKRPPPRRVARKRTAPARQDLVVSPPQCPTDPPGPCLSVLVVGDSLAVGVGMSLDSAFQGRGKVMMRKMGKISTGLDSPRFYDWTGVLKDVLSQEKYDVVVVMLGANDAHNSPGTSAWGRLYESKFSELLKIPAEKRIRTLVVGLPPMRKEDFCARVKVANEAIRNAARLYPETCAYIDSFSRFADEDGNFTDRIRLKGEWKTVRAGDGVHFTGTGYLALGRMVADEAFRRSFLSTADGNRVPIAAKP